MIIKSDNTNNIGLSLDTLATRKDKIDSNRDKTALIIQGGALRGAHTTGVLDVFSQAGITFDTVMGISAGALNGMSYIAGREAMKRAVRINTKYVLDDAFWGLSALYQSQGLYNLNMLFDGNGHDLEPFDYASYLKSPTHFVCGAVNIGTGEIEYFERGTGVDMKKATIASASLPLLTPPVEINGKYYLDGGICEALCYHKALEDGYGKIVLLLTREKGYRDCGLSYRIRRLIHLRYMRHRKLIEALCQKGESANKIFSQIEEDETAKKLDLFVIRPSLPLKVKMGKTTENEMKKLYILGKHDARSVLLELEKWMSANKQHPRIL